MFYEVLLTPEGTSIRVMLCDSTVSTVALFVLNESIPRQLHRKTLCYNVVMSLII